MNTKKSQSNPNTIDTFTSKSRKVWRRISWIVFGRTIPQKIFRIYLVVVLLGAILLYCPFSLSNGYTIVRGGGLDPRPYRFWDALFIACSGFSDTGLTPAVISQTFTIAGEVILFILIEVGGIGIISIFFLIWNLFKKWNNVNINQMVLLQAERGNQKLGNSFKMVRNAVVFIVVWELIFGLIFSIWLYAMPAYEQLVGDFGVTYDDMGSILPCYHNYGKSLWIGIFTSVSAINNAGFDIFDGTWSLASYRNDWNSIFQLLVIIEIIFGGIGYPVIFDVLEKRKNAKKHIHTRTSLFTKVALWSYFIVMICGLAFAYIFEVVDAYANTDAYSILADPNANGEFGKATKFNEVWCIFFNSMVTRSAGFATIDHNCLSTGMKWVNCLLMFIGGSPSSTAGGIRTTTLAIVVVSCFNMMIGRNRCGMFKRTVPDSTVRSALIVTIISFFLIVLASLFISYAQYNQSTEEQFGLLQILYEACSAFGTVGLSVGITSQISPFGQVVLILLMFVGQLGVSSTILSWRKRDPKGNLSVYPNEDIKIG